MPRLFKSRSAASRLLGSSTGNLKMVPMELRTARRKMGELARRLGTFYGTPDLGNLAEPLDEAVFIILSYQTTIARARATLLAMAWASRALAAR